MIRAQISMVLLASVIMQASLLASPARADRPSGVWTGTIGRAAVVTCFDFGHWTYYYVKVGVDIALVERTSGTWDEKSGDRPSTGTWLLSPSRGDSLDGTWRSADGKRALPIRLEKRPGGVDGICQPQAYNVARVDATVRKPGKQATIGWLTVQPFAAIDGTITGLEIVGKASTLSPLRRALEKLNRDIIGQYFDCMTSSASAGTQLEFSGAITPEAVTEHFVMVERSSSYDCGGPYPDGGRDFLIFDRNTGKVVDTKSWLTSGVDSLGRKYWKSDDKECADAISKETSFSVWPSKKGLVFEPDLPHVIVACANPVTVPYATLAGKLTPAGKRASEEFQTAIHPASRP
jgi:hypothetical protein